MNRFEQFAEKITYNSQIIELDGARVIYFHPFPEETLRKYGGYPHCFLVTSHYIPKIHIDFIMFHHISVCNYLQVIKHGNGTSLGFPWFYPSKPLFIADLPANFKGRWLHHMPSHLSKAFLEQLQHRPVLRAMATVLRDGAGHPRDHGNVATWNPKNGEVSNRKCHWNGSNSELSEG